MRSGDKTENQLVLAKVSPHVMLKMLGGVNKFLFTFNVYVTVLCVSLWPENLDLSSH